jgi:hypothetical protein
MRSARVNCSAFSAHGSGVLGANMGRKLVVALLLEVPQHFAKRFANSSGICWIDAGERRHFHHDHHFQQCGRVTNTSRDADEFV